MGKRYLQSLCWVLIFWGIVSCRDELAPLENNLSIASEGRVEMSVARLHQALDRDYYTTERLRSGGMDSLSSPLSFESLRPLWDKAQIFQTHGRYSVLRVPVMAAVSWSRVTDELTEEFSKCYPKANVTYIVRVEDEVYSEGRNYFMHLIPSLKFLMAGISLETESSLIPRGFDGEIELYHLDGRPLSREFYAQGRRYKCYRYNESDMRSSSTESRDGYECYKVQEKREYNYIDWEANEVVVVAEKERIRCYPRSGFSEQTISSAIGGGVGSGGRGNYTRNSPQQESKQHLPPINEEIINKFVSLDSIFYSRLCSDVQGGLH